MSGSWDETSLGRRLDDLGVPVLFIGHPMPGDGMDAFIAYQHFSHSTASTAAALVDGCGAEKTEVLGEGLVKVKFKDGEFRWSSETEPAP